MSLDLNAFITLGIAYQKLKIMNRNSIKVVKNFDKFCKPIFHKCKYDWVTDRISVA